MFTKHNRGSACSTLEARLEDYQEGRLDARETAEVEIHVRTCARCATAIEKSKASTGLLGALRARPAPAPSAFFVARVMTAIRGEQRERDMWKPVERAAWRFCWLASAAVLVLAFLMLRIERTAPTVVAPQQSQVQVLVNVPAAQPATQDDTFLLVASDDNGR